MLGLQSSTFVLVDGKDFKLVELSIADAAILTEPWSSRMYHWRGESIFLLDFVCLTFGVLSALRSTERQYLKQSGFAFRLSTELSSCPLVRIRPCTDPWCEGYHGEGNQTPGHFVYACNPTCSCFDGQQAGMPRFSMQKMHSCRHSALWFCGSSCDYHHCHFHELTQQFALPLQASQRSQSSLQWVWLQHQTMLVEFPLPYTGSIKLRNLF